VIVDDFHCDVFCIYLTCSCRF